MVCEIALKETVNSLLIIAESMSRLNDVPTLTTGSSGPLIASLGELSTLQAWTFF